MDQVTQPTIGVIIEVHGSDQRLQSALAGLAGQGLRPTEVLVIDDASGTSTSKVADLWCNHLPLTVFRFDEQLGTGSKTQNGINHLSSDVVAILDADNYWLPDHLESLLDQYVRKPGIVRGGALHKPAVPAIKSWLGQRLAAKNAEGSQHSPQDASFNGCLFPRELYQAVNRNDPTVRKTDDDMWLRMVEAGAAVSVVPHPTFIDIADKS